MLIFFRLAFMLDGFVHCVGAAGLNWVRRRAGLGGPRRFYLVRHRVFVAAEIVFEVATYSS